MGHGARIFGSAAMLLASLLQGCSSVPPASRIGRRFDAPAAIRLQLTDATPGERLAAMKELLFGLGGDVRVSLDEGLVCLLEEIDEDRVYEVDFHVVLPVANLADPDLNTFFLLSWTVHGPNASINDTDTARERTRQRLLTRIRAAIAAGTPLAGRVVILGPEV